MRCTPATQWSVASTHRQMHMSDSPGTTHRNHTVRIYGFTPPCMPAGEAHGRTPYKPCAQLDNILLHGSPAGRAAVRLWLLQTGAPLRAAARARAAPSSTWLRRSSSRTQVRTPLNRCCCIEAVLHADGRSHPLISHHHTVMLCQSWRPAFLKRCTASSIGNEGPAVDSARGMMTGCARLRCRNP